MLIRYRLNAEKLTQLLLNHCIDWLVRLLVYDEVYNKMDISYLQLADSVFFLTQ